MPQRKNILRDMKRSPTGWRIKSCQALANSCTIKHREGKKGHHVFMFGLISWSIPGKGEIKPCYIKTFVKLLEIHNGTDST